MKVLLTGGAGFIGSHTAIDLILKGYEVLILDNLSNSSTASLRCIEKITGVLPSFIEGDIRDGELLAEVFKNNEINAVMHFAGLKAVAESSLFPLKYYENNVAGTLALCAAMNNAGVFNLIFSSSATVYGVSNKIPFKEESASDNQANPYGRSKAMIEEVLADLAKSDERWSIAILRYFNPIGAHHSGLLGEAPNGIPNNLVPFITQVLVGKLDKLTVYGNDFHTKDGTGVRDYIHIEDLSSGHIAALNFLENNKGINIWNLGSGKGHSVLEVIRAFEVVSGKPVPYVFSARRAGDVSECWADPSKAFLDLGWKASRSLNDMARDAWHWEVSNLK
jgi:UDP-glucose 4-epimerase